MEKKQDYNWIKRPTPKEKVTQKILKNLKKMKRI